MAKYTAISEIVKTIVDLLRAELVPELAAQPELIGACDPHDRGNCVVGIHIYDVSESGESRINTPVSQPDGTMRNPPVVLTIQLMISVASKAEREMRTLDEQMILGKILQVMNDNKRLPVKYMPPTLKAAEETITVSNVPMEMEDKTKIWTMFNEPYRLSVFYRVGPVMIESASVFTPAVRVTEVHLESRQKRKGKSNRDGGRDGAE